MNSPRRPHECCWHIPGRCAGTRARRRCARPAPRSPDTSPRTPWRAFRRPAGRSRCNRSPGLPSSRLQPAPASPAPAEVRRQPRGWRMLRLPAARPSLRARRGGIILHSSSAHPRIAFHYDRVPDAVRHSSCRSAEPGPYRAPALVTAPALQRTTPRRAARALRPGNASNPPREKLHQTAVRQTTIAPHSGWT